MTKLLHFCNPFVSNTKSNTLGFGIVGFGHIGKKHAIEIQNNPNTQLIYVCDINPDVFSALPPHSNHCTDIQDLLQSNLVDVITIATPNGTHADIAIQALQAGKHVVIEKPMALTSLDCDRIIESARLNSKHAFCVMQNRFSPPSQWLKDVITHHRLGKIYQVLVQCWWNRDERYYTPNHWHGTMNLDGGVLFTQFSHFIDLLHWLLGDITITTSKQFNFNHQHLTQFPDAGNFDFEFGENRDGKGQFIYSTSIFQTNFESSITIVGEKGTIKVGGQYMNEIVYCNVQDYQLPPLPPTNAPNHYGNYSGSASNHEFVIQEVVNTLLRNQPVQTTAEEGKSVVQLIESINSLAKKNI